MNESEILPYSSVQCLVAGTALVLAPHPDDEVLGCGGAILRHVAAGDKVNVVIFTDGGAASGAAGFQGDYVQTRKDEARAAAVVLGYGEPTFLDYRDRGLVYDEGLVARVSSLIALHRPAVVYAPSFYEVHPDHRALALAALEAVRRHGGALSIALYEIGNPQMPNRLLDASDLTPTLKQAMRCFPSQLQERPYDSYVLEGLNRFRAYTLGAGVTAAEGYWLATGAELQQRRPGLYRALLGAWADAGAERVDLPPVPTVAPLVSIVVRSIGRDSLAETLDSIATQTWPHVEIVLVAAAPGVGDTARTGGCWRYPLRVVGGEQPLARPQAGNLGLVHARGEFIVFLDDDDLIDPDHVASLAQLLCVDADAVAAYGGVRLRTSRDPGAPDTAIFHEQFSAQQLAYDNYLPIHGVMFRRRVIDEGCRLDEDLALYEDWDFWLQVSRLGGFLRSDRVTATYISTGGSGAGAADYDPQIAYQARLAIYRKWLGLWQPTEINRIFDLNRATTRKATDMAEQNRQLASEVSDLNGRLAAMQAELAALRDSAAASPAAPAQPGDGTPPGPEVPGATACDPGQAHWLLHGLFDHADQPLAEVQRRMADRLLAELPAAPARVLVVGSGGGALLAELARRGLDALGLEADAAMFAQARRTFGDSLPLVAADLAGWQPDAGAPPFDAILFHGTAQRLSPIVIFDRAMDLLAPQGRIVILDAFALERRSWSPEPMHLLASFAAMGQRLGFAVTVEQDLTAAMLKNLSATAPMLARLPAAGAADGPDAAHAEARAGFGDGRLGYRLLTLRFEADPGWRLRPVTADTHQQFASLFRDTFGNEMSQTHWQWKYAEGRGESIGVWEGEQLTAHYGGISRPALAFGHPTLLALPGDVMARKRAHRGLGGKSAFFAAAATMQELHLGLGTRHLISAGFPNSHHAGRAARRLGLYGGTVDRVLELRWPAAAAPEPLQTEWIEPPRHAAAAGIVDALWQQMAADLAQSVVAIRDWENLSYRFLNHPDRSYRLHLVRDAANAPIGAIVLRHDGGHVELLDLIGPLANMRRLVAAARDIALRDGETSVWGWFTEECAIPHLATDDCTTRDIQVETPDFSWTKGLPFDKLKGRIWLTAADADFH